MTSTGDGNVSKVNASLVRTGQQDSGEVGNKKPQQICERFGSEIVLEKVWRNLEI